MPFAIVSEYTMFKHALVLFACHGNQNKGCWHDVFRITLILTTSKYFTDDQIIGGWLSLFPTSSYQ